MSKPQYDLALGNVMQDGAKWSRFRQIVIDLGGEDPGTDTYMGWSKKEVDDYIPLGETLLSIKGERASSVN